jgi:hypothetical protein
MKILSRILVVLLVLLGIAFLVVQSRAAAAAKKCQGSYELRLGLDENGCETKQPLPLTDSQMEEWLRIAGVSKECYKIHSYKGHVPKPYRGDLDLVACITKEGAQSPTPKMMQPLGTSQTQRIMFNTSAAKDAFEKQTQVAKK